jgi:hypothetical protein
MSKAKKNRSKSQVSSLMSQDRVADIGAAKFSPPFEGVETVGASSRIRQMRTYVRTHLWAVALIAFLSIGAIGAVLKYLDEDAQRQKHLAAKDRSALSSLNPFLAPPPTPTPLPLRRENLYAGQRLLSSVDSHAQEVPPSDLAIWRPSTSGSVWWVVSGSALGAYSGYSTFTLGSPGDTPEPGDYS